MLKWLKNMIDLDLSKIYLKAVLCKEDIYDDYMFNIIIGDDYIYYYNTFYIVSFYKDYIFFIDLVKRLFHTYNIYNNIIIIL